MVINNHSYPYFNSKIKTGRWLYDKHSQYNYGTGVCAVAIESWKEASVKLLGPSVLGYWDDA